MSTPTLKIIARPGSGALHRLRMACGELVCVNVTELDEEDMFGLPCFGYHDAPAVRMVSAARRQVVVFTDIDRATERQREWVKLMLTSVLDLSTIAVLTFNEKEVEL